MKAIEGVAILLVLALLVPGAAARGGGDVLPQADAPPRSVRQPSEVEVARDRLAEVRDWSLVLDSGFLVVVALLRQNPPLERAVGPADPVSTTSPAVQVARRINGLGVWFPFLLSAAVGVMLASALPWLVMPAKLRGWEDWVWAWLLGASTCLSILATALVFYAWCCDRKPAGRQAPLGVVSKLFFWAGGLALLLVTIAVGLRDVVGVTGLEAVMTPVLLGSVIVFVIALPFAIVCLVYSAAHEHVIWLLVFAVVHLGVMVGVCEALAAWLAYA
jgi:hypothetical protein